MPNKNYIKGRNKEYKIVNRERNRGNIANRTAGSHGPYDVISIDIKNRIIRLIQSKPDTLNAHQAQKIREKNKELNGTFEVKFSVI